MSGDGTESQRVFDLIADVAPGLVETQVVGILISPIFTSEILHAERKDRAELQGHPAALPFGVEAAVHALVRQMEQVELGSDISPYRRREMLYAIGGSEGKKERSVFPQEPQMKQFGTAGRVEPVTVHRVGRKKQSVSWDGPVTHSRGQFEGHGAGKQMKDLVLVNGVQIP